jgi:sulfite exporter TauE/SafE
LPWPTDSLPWILFVTGLAGGAGHCVGMCGPLVAGYAITLRSRAATLPHLLFHTGRLTTYAVAGGIVGASGSFVRVAAWVAPLQSFLLAATGALIALMGLSVGGWLPWARRIEGSGPFQGVLAGVARRAAEAGGPGSAFPLGMATGLLPCGLVYTALLSAARSGMEGNSAADGFVRGFLAMAAFGAGTFPALFLFGEAAAAAGPRLRGAMAKAAAALLVAAGVAFAARAFLR